MPLQRGGTRQLAPQHPAAVVLPLGPKPQQAGLYFRGMLPKVGTSRRWPRRRTPRRATRSASSRPGRVVLYAEEELANEVANLEDRPLALDDDSELSIAGLQDKLLLVETSAGLGRPVGGRPSTHILKLEDRRFRGLVAREAACLRLAAAVHQRRRRQAGPPGGQLPGLGRDPERARGTGKYEHAGGPALVEVAGLLDRHVRARLEALGRLVAATTFTVLTGKRRRLREEPEPAPRRAGRGRPRAAVRHGAHRAVVDAADPGGNDHRRPGRPGRP